MSPFIYYVDIFVVFSAYCLDSIFVQRDVGSPPYVSPVPHPIWFVVLFAYAQYGVVVGGENLYVRVTVIVQLEMPIPVKFSNYVPKPFPGESLLNLD